MEVVEFFNTGNNAKSTTVELINDCIQFMLKKLNIILYNPKILPNNYAKNHYIDFFRLRKNKELSSKTNNTCAWCYKGYNKECNIKLYAIYLHDIEHRRYSTNEIFHTNQYVICHDCMYIMNQLRNKECIQLYDDQCFKSYYYNSYTIYPNKKWIVHIQNEWYGEYVVFDVGFINTNLFNYVKSYENINIANLICQRYIYRKSPIPSDDMIIRITQLINQNNHHYNILIKVYLLLKELLIKDISMTIGCMIILSIKNDVNYYNLSM